MHYCAKHEGSKVNHADRRGTQRKEPKSLPFEPDGLASGPTDGLSRQLNFFSWFSEQNKNENLNFANPVQFPTSSGGGCSLTLELQILSQDFPLSFCSSNTMDFPYGKVQKYQSEWPNFWKGNIDAYLCIIWNYHDQICVLRGTCRLF